MKTGIYTLVAISFLGFKASANNYNCVGVYDENKGAKLQLQVTSPTGAYQLVGTSVPEDGFEATQKCTGAYVGLSRDKKYNQYGSNSASKLGEKTLCTADFVKILPALLTTGSGFLILGRYSGGDTHDNSGYSYRYYHCDIQR